MSVPPPRRPAEELPADLDPVCVPAHPIRRDGRWGVNLELRSYRGEPTAFIFSSPETLVGTLGEHQPWVGLPMVAARNLAELYGVRRFLIDPVSDADLPRWTQGNLRAVWHHLHGANGEGTTR
ncbi:hypothetical protein E6W39_28395 [Kitasatospora acidiphila]|uniref:SseB protein N-terminal domain-containing protein n=1 Tax=Kitasatospora acidiphila TaxID=2567942 RepID=A0A540W8W1_9ACTN|nr:SAV_915 family protein [Kitasatospora acidiphila]TQF05438.1 hypothetical protein E6W39_28395 [Kitasatospora acidiphila]